MDSSFLFWNQTLLFHPVQKELVAATCLSVLNYSDVFVQVFSLSLPALGMVYYWGMRLITNLKALTHLRLLYEGVG